MNRQKTLNTPASNRGDWQRATNTRVGQTARIRRIFGFMAIFRGGIIGCAPEIKIRMGFAEKSKTPANPFGRAGAYGTKRRLDYAAGAAGVPAATADARAALRDFTSAAKASIAA